MPKNHSSEPTDSSLDVDGKRHGARAVVVKPILKSENYKGREAESMLDEAIGLAQAIALDVVNAKILNVAHPTPATLLGSGQVAELATTIKEENIHLLIVDHALTPVQQRNLERDCVCKVIDRTGLILEIFGERARTREGQLQVELAALNYQKSRLVKSWTHLERQRGGFGFLGGPGESQLEIDRRLITNRIAKLKIELKDVQRTRGLHRKARQKAEHPTIALVGYTNAGKSTLFNCLTGADVLAKNMLFATLDPSMRGMVLPSGREVILSDTVGFISDLPTHLIEAFRATLEEVQRADIIIHVRDITHPETRSQKESVESILLDLGIEASDKRLIEVLNKADLLSELERQNSIGYASRTTWDAQHMVPVDGVRHAAQGGTVMVSALTGDGINDLLRALDDHLAASNSIYEMKLSMSEGAAIAWLYGHGQVIERVDKKTHSIIKIAMTKADFGRFQSRFHGDVHAKS